MLLLRMANTKSIPKSILMLVMGAPPILCAIYSFLFANLDRTPFRESTNKIPILAVLITLHHANEIEERDVTLHHANEIGRA